MDTSYLNKLKQFFCYLVRGYELMVGKRKPGLAWSHPAEDRFWRQVDKCSDDECWNWTGTLVGNDGRGRIRVNGKAVYAYRFSYELHIGIIPEGLQVLHKCDNPKCVNPHHLFVGTISDNMKDAYRKKRKSNFGEKNPNSKLTENEVREIRKRYRKDGGAALAKEFGLERTVPYQIFHRKRWGHIV
jgi:hypothetical protein